MEHRCREYPGVGVVGFFALVAVLLPSLPAHAAAGAGRTAAFEAGAEGGVAGMPLTQSDSIDAVVDRGNYVLGFRLATDRLVALSATLGPLHPVTLATLNRVGSIAHLTDDQDTAQDVLDVALAWRSRVLGPGSSEVAETLYWRGLVAKYSEDRAGARSRYDQAITILLPNWHKHQPLLAAIAQAQAELLLRDGKRSLCVRAYKRALGLREDCLPRPSFAIADNLTWLGFALAEVGRYPDATPYLDRAEAELRALHMEDHALMSTILSQRANQLAAHRRWAEAETLYARAARIADAARENSFPGSSRRKFGPIDYIGLATAQLRQGKSETAWQSLQHARGLVSLDFMTLSRWESMAPETFTEISALRRAWLQTRRRLDLARLIDSDPVDRRQWELLLGRLTLQARMADLERAFLLAHRPPVVSSDSVRQWIPAGTALVGQLQTVLGESFKMTTDFYRNQAWLFVLRPDRPLRWMPLWEARSVDQYVEMRAPFDRYVGMWQRATRWPLHIAADPEYTAAARGAGTWFFDPALPELDGIETLIIDASLSSAPLGALVGPDGRCFADRFEIASAPSSRAYVMMRQAQRGNAPGRPHAALAVGNSRPETATALDGRSNGEPRPEAMASAGSGAPVSSPLPHTAGEVAYVASLFPSATVLDDATATRTHLDALADSGQLARFDVLHFATHTRNVGLPQRFALLLTPGQPGDRADDGVLTALEILNGWTLGARLVTLSGCQTGRGPGFVFDELHGLQQVFAAIGAQSVIHTLWEVDDEASALLVRRFYENWTGKYSDLRCGRQAACMSKANALREAQAWLREYRDASGARRFAHPVYWSGFSLTGLPD